MKIVSGYNGILEAAKALANGQIVAYPTDTFYGFAVDAQNSLALQNLKRLKGRAEGKPFPVLLPDRPSLFRYSLDVPTAANLLAERFWPGPLTLILKSRSFPYELSDPFEGVGFRVSNHPLAVELTKAFGRCITATSANLSGEPAAENADDVARVFPNSDILLLDGGSTRGGKPSTIIDLSKSTSPRLVREGAIPWEHIQACFAP